jgi:hypothetical protein
MTALPEGRVLREKFINICGELYGRAGSPEFPIFRNLRAWVRSSPARLTRPFLRIWVLSTRQATTTQTPHSRTPHQYRHGPLGETQLNTPHDVLNRQAVLISYHLIQVFLVVRLNFGVSLTPSPETNAEPKG